MCLLVSLEVSCINTSFGKQLDITESSIGVEDLSNVSSLVPIDPVPYLLIHQYTQYYWAAICQVCLDQWLYAEALMRGETHERFCGCSSHASPQMRTETPPLEDPKLPEQLCRWHHCVFSLCFSRWAVQSSAGFYCLHHLQYPVSFETGRLHVVMSGHHWRGALRCDCSPRC